MQTQVFDVQDIELTVDGALDHPFEREEPVTRKHLLLHKWIYTRGFFYFRNAMQETNRPGSQEGLHLIKKLIGTVLTDMFHHAHRNDAFPLDAFVQFQVTNSPHCHRQSASRGFLTNVQRLIVTQGDAHALDSVDSRRIA